VWGKEGRGVEGSVGYGRARLLYGKAGKGKARKGRSGWWWEGGGGSNEERYGWSESKERMNIEQG
jgi:hypothetical protein